MYVLHANCKGIVHSQITLWSFTYLQVSPNHGFLSYLKTQKEKLFVLCLLLLCACIFTTFTCVQSFTAYINCPLQHFSYYFKMNKNHLVGLKYSQNCKYWHLGSHRNMVACMFGIRNCSQSNIIATKFIAVVNFNKTTILRNVVLYIWKAALQQIHLECCHVHLFKVTIIKHFRV